MCKVKKISYMSSDKMTMIHALAWIPDGEVQGILQISHGMQEFIERYDRFARFMCEHHILVVGNDHLGHGASVRNEEQYGYFAEENGNRCVIQDMRELQRGITLKYPDVPYFVLGHSMGSFLARQYMIVYGHFLDGVIISGTAWHPDSEINTAMALCRIIARSKGWTYRSPFMTQLTMGNYNKKFEPVRTKVDWLTRDEAVVDAYRKDKRTQFMFTLNGYYNMFVGLKALTGQENLRKIPKDLPVLFIAGQMDPVGNFGAGVKKSALSLSQAGMHNIECRLYPNDRHEVLNELNYQEVYKDVWAFVKKILETQEGQTVRA